MRSLARLIRHDPIIVSFLSTQGHHSSKTDAESSQLRPGAKTYTIHIHIHTYTIHIHYLRFLRT